MYNQSAKENNKKPPKAWNCWHIAGEYGAIAGENKVLS
jgi:hypothetical protein